MDAKEKSLNQARTVITRLFSSGGDLKSAARFAGVSTKLAKQLASKEFSNANPEIEAWKKSTFTSKEMTEEKADEILWRWCNVPPSLAVRNATFGKLQIQSLELWFKRKGLLKDSKNIEVNIHTDYTVQLQEAWKLREARKLKNVTIESVKVLPAPANSGGSPSQEIEGS